MAVIDAAEANRLALYRLASVLGAGLADEVALLNDTGNTCPVPGAAQWYIAPSETILTEVLNAQDVAGFIYPLGPSVRQDARTGAANGDRAMLYLTTYRVIVLFKTPAGWTAYSVAGREVLESELVFHLADRVRGAMLRVVYRDAQADDTIHQVEVTAQFADLVTLNNNQLTGRAVLDIEVLQDVAVPMAQYP